MTAALSLVSGMAEEEVDAQLRAAAPLGGPAATRQEVETGLEDVIRYVHLAPIGFSRKPAVVDPLKGLLEDLPELGSAEVQAWRGLRKELPIAIVDVERSPVLLPPMPEPQESAWRTLLDLEDGLDCHWCLIGGQMVTLILIEHGWHEPHRPTDDGDVVLGVWLERQALSQATGLLRGQGYDEDSTSDGYGYRYRRERATIDLLLPEEIGRQQRVPRTTSGRPGIEVPGGNQALIRSERLPVQLGERVGRVRRPNLLGALVAKAAAATADTRDAGRHLEDLVLLGEVALTSGAFRAMRRESKGRDRRRLRRALERLPDGHSAWRRATEGREVRVALERLARPVPRV